MSTYPKPYLGNLSKLRSFALYHADDEY